MSEHPCFETLDRSRKAYSYGEHQQSLALAEASYRMLKEIPGAPPQAGLVIGWYGFLLAHVGKKKAEALKLVREAANAAFWEPRVFEYLARVELQSGGRDKALRAVRRGLALAPGDRELGNLRRMIGVRGKPTLSFLDRSHPLNRMFGQWRAHSAS